jgi:hypothetical protein
MEAYTNQIQITALRPATIYKITTTKSSFLGKYQGKNRNEHLHFFDQATDRLVVLDPKEHIVSVHSNQ